MDVHSVLRCVILAVSYVEGFLLCLLVHRRGWSHQPVVLQSISCVGGILACKRLPNSSYVYPLSMFSVIVMCLLLVRIYVYFVGYVMHRLIVGCWFLYIQHVPYVLHL